MGLCSGEESVAAEVLGLGVSQAAEVARNAHLWEAPTKRADEVYAGVLYEALDATSLSPAARRRATSRLAIVSSVFGLVRPSERIAAYRLSGDVTLPGLGRVAAHWREQLGPVAAEYAGGGLTVDLRSSSYAAFFKPVGRVATVRVLHEHEGRRTVVSHFNKATKGRLVRALLEDGANPRTTAALAEAWRDLGWDVERDGDRLDVVIAEL